MSRKLWVAAIAIVSLHLVQEIVLGVRPLGSLVANLLQIAAAVLAAVVCFSAARRGTGFTRPFWALVGCSFLAWSIANSGWIYYETFLHIEPPSTSIFSFLVDTRSLFLIVALLLDQREDSANLDPASILDFVQMGIIFGLVFLGFYYVPTLGEASRELAILRAEKIEVGEDLAVLALALMHAARARKPQIRSMYLAIMTYIGIVTIGTVITARQQLIADVPTGTWLDLWWTGPYLVAALWAAQWQPAPSSGEAGLEEKHFAGVLLDNTIFAVAPLIVLLQVSLLGPDWRRLSFLFLGVSILCFAARLALSEFRESRSVINAHKADQQRLEAESKFRIAFEANPEGITISSLDDGTYVEVNNVFVRSMEFDRSELIGKSALDLNLWVDKNERARLVDALQRDGRVSDWEIKLRTKSGRERQVVLSAHLAQVQGRMCMLSILRDVTEQKLLELRFHQAQKMEAVGRLAGGVAHDFNNLLMITSGSAQLLEQSKHDPAKVEHYVRQIQNASERGASLTRQLLAFSRQQVLNPSILDLNSVITGLWKMLPRLLGEDVHAVLSLDSALGQVSADRGQLEQVLMNLAVNARDAMPQGGKLTVRTANVVVHEDTHWIHGVKVPPGPYVLLSVGDTGVGMTPEVQAQIFDPFFTTKEQGKGTGLGLATVYGSVRQNGGYICVDSAIGRGTTFEVYLPRVEPKKAAASVAPTIEEVPRGTGTILLVEDENALREVASEYLRARGYQVVEANSGDRALELCKSHPGAIDLLITDIVMPGSSGPNVAKVLSQARPGLPTIFMSGYTDRPIGPEILGPNATFFQKPFSLDALARKVHTILNGKR